MVAMGFYRPIRRPGLDTCWDSRGKVDPALVGGVVLSMVWLLSHLCSKVEGKLAALEAQIATV
jgi:hypothetical protein